MGSEMLKLNWLDMGKAALTAFIASIATVIYKFTETGQIPDVPTIKTALWVALLAGIGSVIRRFLTNSDGKPLAKEPDKI